MNGSQNTNLKTLYYEAYKNLQSVDSKIPFSKFQSIHRQFIQLGELIESSDIYSSNEEFSEVDTAVLKYILVPYDHAKFIDGNAVSSQMSGNLQNDAMKRNKLRLLVLKIVESMLWKFVNVVVYDMKLFDFVNQNSVADVSVLGMLKKWLDVYKELRSREVANEGANGFVKLNELEQASFKSTGPMGRRDMKIGKWKLEKELKEKVKIIEKSDNNNSKEDDTFDLSGLDDTIIRKVKIDQILLAIVDSVGILENSCMEREMLSNVVNNEDINDLDVEGIRLTEIKDNESDTRTKGKFDQGYTDKLETIHVTKDQLVSKEGKVLRPFTIVPSNQKRKELQGKVFGTGQELPTITVEELVDQELANGGMVKPQEPEPEIDEDDYKWQDKETARLRDWDDFTDTHKKGSGNKMGNLG
jgi:immunoglobulin-binding protein 1